jgi:RNA polymerase sigma factor (sigma-70 family)
LPFQRTVTLRYPLAYTLCKQLRAQKPVLRDQATFIMSEDSDDILIAELIAGSEQAFARVYKRYYQPLLLTCLRTIRPKGMIQDAQDIVSMTFLKLYERRTKMRSQASVTNFLYLAVRTGSIDFLRKAGRSMESSLDITELQAANDELDMVFLERIIQEEQVLQLVNELPERSKQVIELYYLQGKKYREIGAELNISPRTVENQLRYALDKLRLVLSNKKMAGILILFIASLTGTMFTWAVGLILLHISGMLSNL